MPKSKGGCGVSDYEWQLPRLEFISKCRTKRYYRPIQWYTYEEFQFIGGCAITTFCRALAVSILSMPPLMGLGPFNPHSLVCTDFDT